MARIKDHPIVDGQPAVSLQVPLISNNTILGLMIFADTKSRSFLSTDIYLMDILGRQLSIGVENVRLFDNLEQLVNERTDDDKTLVLAVRVGAGAGRASSPEPG